ncbi:3-phenylpropionate/trans-cinnamate dioxygenase ferredoxin subunit [Kibdelosporangium banguiense]|uniref:3-phenylpropionate/trans-cinnamate dioxygenase ferredoxin subunit n=1 Tax=Kibdelosporangium banguiense TaxID=1365924 RepID=A0ABS4TXU5_9PSEU|nr:bifunctional 3-phenylpropionate/cinnamic acid dioxygenase ferredoxin subunit [Kibdelosporangium banguiense]MBP2329222.1 3-phenylpropionate/trans-cinnamate dioxygenase ferredoxin subunit [Kibdelosporangium banguiense]
MSQEIRVAAVDDIDEGDAITVDAKTAGTPDDIAIFHSGGGGFYALDDTCTHETASLADGWIEGKEVECPVHAAKFCLLTGKALCLPATRAVRTHRVEVRDGAVWLTPNLAVDA